MAIDLNDALALDYLAESREHLANMETDLPALEAAGAEIDEGLADRVLRAVHSVKAGAGLFGLARVHELAQQTERALALIRSRQMVPTRDRVSVLVGAADRLQDLIENPGVSNHVDVSDVLAALATLQDPRTSAGNPGAPASGRGSSGGPLRMLLVEDDFASRLMLQTFLSRYGECHIAVNGREAVEAFRAASESGQGYGLICMDIMMPEMDGREAVRQVRAIEAAHGILSTYGAKIIMTTALAEIKDVGGCFMDLCDAYLVKPIDLRKLLGHIKSFQLIR